MEKRSEECIAGPFPRSQVTEGIAKYSFFYVTLPLHNYASPGCRHIWCFTLASDYNQQRGYMNLMTFRLFYGKGTEGVCTMSSSLFVSATQTFPMS